MRMLVVEDNPDDRTLIVRAMTAALADAQMDHILNAAAFAGALEKGGFELVLTDFELGWTSGLDVVRIVKKQYPDCPVVMFTGSGNEEIAVEGMKLGLDDYVLKSSKHYVRLPAAVEAALERAQERVAKKQLERRYQDLFEHVPVGIFKTTPEGRLIDCNPAMIEMLGVPDKATLCALNMNRFYANPVDRTAWVTHVERENIVRNYEVAGRRYDGAIFWFETNTKAIRNAEGQIVCYEGTVKDVTERRLAMDSGKALAASLAAKNREMEQRLREITALNELFRKHIQQVHTLTEHCEQLFSRLDTLYQEATRMGLASIAAEVKNLMENYQPALQEVEEKLSLAGLLGEK